MTISNRIGAKCEYNGLDADKFMTKINVVPNIAEVHRREIE